MTIVQGGSTANRTGIIMEKQIRPVIEGAGYVYQSKSVVIGVVKQADDFSTIGDKWFTDQIALERNLYGAKYRTDFFLYNSEKFPHGLHIECKWQASGGSVDEKYVFTVLTLKDLKSDSVMVLDGGGARLGAVKWIKSQETKKFRFFGNISQFNNWAKTNL